MNIIDVTLRDGGHAVDFDWPIEMAQEYYSTVSEFPEVDFIELGYWKQTSKSENRFYNLNMEEVLLVTNERELGNVSIMIDYHYCSHNVEDYPKKGTQKEIGIIRICARHQDVKGAIVFAEKLKKHTGLNVSFNVFNVTNYTNQELKEVTNEVIASSLDYVYFADTHGRLDLDKDGNKLFGDIINEIKACNKKSGLHLHNHSGLAVHNFKQLDKFGFEFSDTSIRGMGKGSGNLALEHTDLSEDTLLKLSEFIRKYKDFLTMNPNPYELITALFNITDNYAKQGNELGMKMDVFYEKCKQASGYGKFVFNPDILND